MESHSRTVPSSPAEASVLPSGLKATLVTGSVWTFRASPSARCVVTSQSRTARSSPAEAKVLPSGLKATLVTPFGVGDER